MRWKASLFFLGIALMTKIFLIGLTIGKLDGSARGYLIEGDTQVVVTHGGLANAESMLAWSFSFADQGYAVELMDLPNHGSWYAKSMTSKQAKQLWWSKIESRQPAIGIGHSLGSYPVNDAPFPLRLLIGSYRGESTKQRQHHFGRLFPEKWYVLDHVLEPWNPILIETVLRGIGKRPSTEDRFRIWGYCLLPWIVFLSGLLGGILLTPRWTLTLAGDSPRETTSALLAALLMIVLFIGTTTRALWNPVLFSFLEWGIFVGCSFVAWGINAVCTRWLFGWISTFLVASWLLLCTAVITVFWEGWPGTGIMELFQGLMVVVAILVFAVSRVLNLPTVYSKNLCAGVLYAYALAVLTPKLYYTELIPF